MKTRPILLTVATPVIAVTLCFAAGDVNMGTWKLNEAKSKIGRGSAKNITVVYAAAGDSVKVTDDGVDADGKPAHDESTGKFDGKNYPVTGNPAYDTRAYKLLNDYTLALTDKKGDKVVHAGLIVISADGKRRTVVTSSPAEGYRNRRTRGVASAVHGASISLFCSYSNPLLRAFRFCELPPEKEFCFRSLLGKNPTVLLYSEAPSKYKRRGREIKTEIPVEL